MDEGVNNLLYYRPVNLSVNPLNFGEFALLHAYNHDIVKIPIHQHSMICTVHF